MFEAYAQASGAPTDPATIDALAANAPKTVDQAVRIDPAFILSKVEAWVVGFQRLLPNIVVALVVFAIVFAIAWSVERSFRAWSDRHDRSNLGAVLGSFVKWMIVLFGALIALTIVTPSLNPGDLFAGLGIGSVAIGFAFKDILQNWLAGLLILIQRPFKPGDQIVVNGYEGTVEWIETRATIIDMYDGRRVIIPNANVYSNAVTVNTARPTLQATAINVRDLVLGIAELVASTSGPNVHVSVDIPADLPAARADANQLEMAILNLSVNARDAMPDGGTLNINALPVVIPRAKPRTFGRDATSAWPSLTVALE